jgi:hypothetical protein
MSFRQVYYTSCRTGLRGSPGFQINALSPGIPDSVVQQVERLCVYVPPVSAPGRPAQAELDQLPLSLISQRLQDGTAVVAQARYIGVDYSGRFGNYFAHSLITTRPDKDFADRLPIELWRSPGWQVSESAKLELPEVAQAPAAGALSLAAVARFLAEKGRGARLAAFLTAAEQALGTRRRIVIVDSSDAVAHWIAAACFALPRNLALELTFNTYVKSPYQSDALVIGTTPDSDFGFAPHEINHMVFLFDFDGDRFTPIEEPSAFGRALAALYTEGAVPRIAAFVEFAEQVAPDLAVAELALAFAAFCEAAGLGSALAPAPPPSPSGLDVARFCADRLERFAAASVGGLISRLLTGPVADAVTPALLLLRAARRDAVPDAVRTAALASLTAWIVREAAAQAEVGALAQLSDELAPAAQRIDAARPHRGEWLALLERTSEPVRLLLQVQLGERLGYLDSLGDLFARLGERHIGPALANERVQELLAALAASDDSAALLDGVAAHLLERVDDQALFGRTAPLYAHSDVALRLDAWAVARRALLLRFRIFAARAEVDAGGRSAAFQRCLAAVASEQGASTPELVRLTERAYEAVWPDGVPAASEALQILGDVPPDVLVQSQLLARLARCLVLKQHTPITKAQQELAERLGRQPLRAALGDGVLLCDLFTAAMRLHQDDWAAHVVPVLSCARQAGEKLSEGVCRLAAESIAGLREISEHQRLLQEALGACEWFAEPYLLAMEAQLVSGPRLAPAEIAALLRFWLGLRSASGEPLLPDRRINETLAATVSGWGLIDLFKARRALGQDAAARERLGAIVRESERWQRRRRFLLKLSLGASALVLVLVAAIAAGIVPNPIRVLRQLASAQPAGKGAGPPPHPQPSLSGR